jgi:hypothetical protein
MVHLTNDAVQKKSEEYGKFECGNKVETRHTQRVRSSSCPTPSSNGILIQITVTSNIISWSRSTQEWRFAKLLHEDNVPRDWQRMRSNQFSWRSTQINASTHSRLFWVFSLALSCLDIRPRLHDWWQFSHLAHRNQHKSMPGALLASTWTNHSSYGWKCFQVSFLLGR